MQLRAPHGRVSAWIARIRDPETNRIKDIVIPPGNDTQRVQFCISLSEQLQSRNREIKGGAVPHREADQPLAEAIKRYFDQASVRARTLESYQEARDRLLEWGEENGLHTLRHLNRAQLVRYRAHMVQLGRSEQTTNTAFRRTAVLINWLIDAQLVKMTREDVRVAFKALPTDEVTRRDFLRREQIKALLEAAKRHDGITYKATRGGEQLPRYSPIHDYIRFLLLSGLRPGEALALTWDRVDLDAHQLHVHPTQSKRRHDRTVELDVCPTLIEMLERMKGKSHERVWAIHTKGSADSTLDRLRADSLCPAFDYQLLRVTAATYLANMPSFGPVQESRQLGHSIVVAERFYVGRVKIAPEVKTLEEAYGL